MNRPKSLLEEMIADDPELTNLFSKTREQFQKAAEEERRFSGEAEIISPEDLAVIVR
ncbi:MAG: hypothetical protein PHG25_01580 [Candidatus Pacebacteria bacterium]|nr:hypothetical protein [Candidatus Paceibacterota bacterium]